MEDPITQGKDTQNQGHDELARRDSSPLLPPVLPSRGQLSAPRCR